MREYGGPGVRGVDRNCMLRTPDNGESPKIGGQKVQEPKWCLGQLSIQPQLRVDASLEWAASGGGSCAQTVGPPGIGSAAGRGRTCSDIVTVSSVRIVQGPDPWRSLCSFSSSHLLGLPGLTGFSLLAAQAARVVRCENNREALWGSRGAVAEVER